MRCGTQGCRAAPRQVVALEVMGCREAKMEFPYGRGESSLFEEYVEACLLYEQTVVKEKRYLCGPRVAAELQGPARRVLIGRSADWLSQEGVARKLIAA